jgi:DNA modification methylase
MPSINLTEDELTTLMEAVNSGAEPSPELAGKLFPSLMEKLSQEGKFDFETLNRIRIPTIEYAGKRSEGVILASAVALGQSAPLQVVRSFGESGDDGWRNLIVQGDNLQFLKTVYLNQDPLIRDKVKGKVKLIYIDPPFATRSDFRSSDGTKSYSDKIGTAEFLENLRERLLFLREALADDGTVYVHCDWRMNSAIRVILDELFDPAHSLNQITWKRIYSHSDAKRFGIIDDTILIYTKTDNYIFNKQFKPHSESYIKSHYGQIDKDGDRFRLVTLSAAGPGPARRFGDKMIDPPPGRHWAWSQARIDEGLALGKIVFASTGQPNIKQHLRETSGTVIQSIWDDIQPVNPISAELLDYPTQKPEALLERIIKASSNPFDLVMDVFAGSGTTAAVAEKLGRRWIVCDFGKHAIYTMQKRIFNIAESKAFDTTKKDAKYGQPTKHFSVASVGAYDFSRVMHLRENKCAYISFVLALFGIPKEDKNFIGKYKLDQIYAEKDGDPVEIFPVWEDDYLYSVRIDLTYLQDIITQSRGRLTGNYYIVVPENCTQVSDIKVPNGTGGEVHFRFLKFPYSILEQASRNFAIEDQPDTPENINNLVSSVGFYFNDEVTVKVAKSDTGLRISEFTTPIPNRDGTHYEGLSGLSLLLVDLNYNGEVFAMNSAIYATEMKENGNVGLAGVNGKTAVIAIDRHGNESKPTLISE